VVGSYSAETGFLSLTIGNDGAFVEGTWKDTTGSGSVFLVFYEAGKYQGRFRTGTTGGTRINVASSFFNTYSQHGLTGSTAAVNL
jgi:hypothetical protein